MVKFWEDGNLRVRIFVGAGILQGVDNFGGGGNLEIGRSRMEQGLIPAWRKGYTSTLLSPHLKPVSPNGTLCNRWGAPDVPKWEPHGTTHPKDGMALIPGDTYRPQMTPQ